MNSEHYADPTADEVINKIMREEAKNKNGKKRIFKNDSRAKVVLGKDRKSKKHRSKTKKKRNARNS